MNYTQHRAKILAQYNHCCAWCGGDGSNYDLCLDHIDPQGCGGSDNADNLQILCRRCNSIKWRYRLPRLNPRQPQPDIDKQRRRQDYLKNRVMAARKKTDWFTYIPRSQLGY